jgi:hypothetical protein
MVDGNLDNPFLFERVIAKQVLGARKHDARTQVGQSDATWRREKLVKRIKTALLVPLLQM